MDINIRRIRQLGAIKCLPIIKKKQNIPEVIPVSSTVSLSKSPTPTQILDALQGELEGHLSEARQIHMDMLTVKRLFGVEYEIKALSLVG